MLTPPSPRCPARWPRRSGGRTRRSASRTSSRSPRTGGLGRRRPPGVGAVRLRGRRTRDLLDSGAELTIAENYAAVGKTQGLTTEPRPPGRRRLRQPDRVVRRPLRRHHDHVPQPGSPPTPLATALTYTSGSGRRGEERHRLQPGQPRRGALTWRDAAVPAPAAWRSTPRRGTLYSDSPFHRCQHRVGGRRRAGRRRPVRAARRATQEPAEGPRTASGRTTGRPLAAPIVAATASTRHSRRPTSRCRRRRAHRDPGLVGRAAQGTPVLLVLDISGSMGEFATEDGRTRLDLAQEAAVGALDEFKANRRRRALGVQHDLEGPDPNVRGSCRSARSERATRRSRCHRGPVPDERHAAERRHRAGVHEHAGDVSTRHGSTPSCS